LEILSLLESALVNAQIGLAPDMIIHIHISFLGMRDSVISLAGHFNQYHARGPPR
jgi:hypothetical protein